MVKEMRKGRRIYFACEECGLLYKEKAWAEECQKWCRENKSCNLEIIKQAIKND